MAFAPNKKTPDKPDTEIDWAQFTDFHFGWDGGSVDLQLPTEVKLKLPVNLQRSGRTLHRC